MFTTTNPVNSDALNYNYTIEPISDIPGSNYNQISTLWTWIQFTNETKCQNKLFLQLLSISTDIF